MTATRDDLTARRLREVLDYDPETGVLTRHDTGRVAGWHNGNGYIKVMVYGHVYAAHRLVWLYVTGSWPLAEVDHVNCDRGDNRFVNLREASRFENRWNVKKRADNATGFKGIRTNKKGWQATITVNRRRICLGTFKTPEEAHAAYVAAAARLRGAFARVE